MRIPAAFVVLALALSPAARGEIASRVETPPAVTIVVLGDSLAEGLWASLYRRFARERGVRIVNAARASTGFNADHYDAVVENLLARGKIDLLIVQTGANDRQRAVALDGRSAAPFASATWHSYYSQRLTYFLARLQRHGVPVLWVGLPVMRDESFDRGMRLITRMHQSHAERHGASFLDIAAFTADADGAFVEKLRRVRGASGASATKTASISGSSATTGSRPMSWPRSARAFRACCLKQTHAPSCLPINLD